MIQYIYSGDDAMVKGIQDLEHLFDVYCLAEKVKKNLIYTV